MTEASAPSWQEAHDTLQKLKEQLDLAYETAANGMIEDQIDKRLDELDYKLTAMNQKDMASRTPAINAAAAQLTDPLKQLNALKTDLQSIGNDVKKAATVLAQVDELVGQISTCFGI